MGKNKNLFEDLAKILDDNKMQVTFTGWKAELEKCESLLAAAQEENRRLRNMTEKLKALLLLTDPSVSHVAVTDLAIEQWNEFVREFPDESGVKA